MTVGEVEYDAIAKEYAGCKVIPFKKDVELPLLCDLLTDSKQGGLQGCKVLDLACGEGFYSRFMRIELGAASVVGVDLSPEQIALAHAQQKANPIENVSYFVGDVGALQSVLPSEYLGSFDVILMAWLLNYARTEEQLCSFVANASHYLKPGGRLVGINNYPENSGVPHDKYQSYNFVKCGSENHQAGDEIPFVLTNPDGTFCKFSNFYLPLESHEKAFQDANLDGFEWRALKAPDEKSSQQQEPHFWDVLLSEPTPFKGFRAVRPNRPK
mmetsp:Transcript_11931/g.25973  ORF Transcript_11931/g.25973 Transcript_11931/m.25973 type:complete len:270 (-) Transcript_11931:172-981(-)|eukprot:CAMPEP_0185844536 /NCGR_PEP_ID=MMETSP1354-20130828/662_1 /TAXON_ID=708628 /ORGANISM="Erythrolobus madagascarensis, Strain CCMP3276" /LENGTH=269 /DNA_ID=CAMNT_0028544217 /DNA_START=121 /DNA_END=930 /DNA_ORIENTATION=+